MQRCHYATVIAAVALIACTDNTTTAPPGVLTGGSDHQTVTLTGMVQNNPTGELIPPLVLRTPDGMIVGLYGGVSQLLQSVLGAQVQVDGEQLTELAVEVQSFLVLMVGDQPARDGVLIQTGAGEYMLRLTKTGEYDRVIDPSGELRARVGDRLWMTGPADGPPSAFGVIQ
jgi:hypothetical protein